MVNVNAEAGSSVEAPFGESSLPCLRSLGVETPWRLPFSHGLNPGGVSEIRRLLKRQPGPRGLAEPDDEGGDGSGQGGSGGSEGESSSFNFFFFYSFISKQQ